MTLPRTVAEVLSDHVVFEIECIDRMYLNVYQPRLQYGGGVSAFFVGHRGHKYASSVLMQPITDAFVANIHHYIAAHDLDLVHFGKGQSKDDIAHRYLAEATGAHGEDWEGVLFVGRAQEKASVFRTQKRRNPVTGTGYLWLTRTTVQVNYFYFYSVDTDFGPFFIKFCTYFPYNARLCINGQVCRDRRCAALSAEVAAPARSVRAGCGIANGLDALTGRATCRRGMPGVRPGRGSGRVGRLAA